MVRSLMFVLITALSLMPAEGIAGRRSRGDGQHCARDKQCASGRCCNGFCSSDAACCDPFAGEVVCDVDLCCNTLAGQACCNDPVYGLRCADTDSENANCGACGNECQNGTFCAKGQCVCPSGETLCNGYCVDTATDPNNCGSCGNVCPSGVACQNGQCGTCDPSFPTVCGGDGTVRCCPEGYGCCFGGRNIDCVPPGNFCCISSIGDAYDCSAGQHCCGGVQAYPCYAADQPCPGS
jgi:stigma-specific protein Stig1